MVGGEGSSRGESEAEPVTPQKGQAGRWMLGPPSRQMDAGASEQAPRYLLGVERLSCVGAGRAPR